jgi:hypothetical protein
MVVVDMRPMPSKAIGRKVYLWARNLFRLSKDHRPKTHPNTQRREESKEARDPMKVKDGGVHHNKYDGYCMKQQIRIPNAT